MNYPDDMNDWKKEMFKDVKRKLNNPRAHGHKVATEEQNKRSNSGSITKEGLADLQILIHEDDMDVEDFIKRL